jgi:DNA invertase Pin-like site-specific DNA recombinase
MSLNGAPRGSPAQDALRPWLPSHTSKERQLEGIARAKAAGVYKGRKRKVSIAEAQQLKAEGKSNRGDCPPLHKNRRRTNL